MGDLPTLMTKAKTTLIQKDAEEGNAANNTALSHAYMEAADWCLGAKSS